VLEHFRTPPEAYLAQSARDLSSPAASTRAVAARFFQYRWPREVDAGRHKAVAHGLAVIAAEPDGPGSRAALAALKNWGGPEALPVLLAAGVDRPEEAQRLAAEAARQIVARLRSTSPR
jgi:hypothetical protein